MCTRAAALVTASATARLSNSQQALSMSRSQNTTSRGGARCRCAQMSRTPVMEGVPEKGNAQCNSFNTTVRHLPICFEMRRSGCPACVISRRLFHSFVCSTVFHFCNIKAEGACPYLNPKPHKRTSSMPVCSRLRILFHRYRCTCLNFLVHASTKARATSLTVNRQGVSPLSHLTWTVCCPIASSLYTGH